MVPTVLHLAQVTMAPLTRAQAAAELRSIIETIMGQSADDPLASALAKAEVVDVPMLVGLRERDIDALTYDAVVDTETTARPLSFGHRNMLRAFIFLVKFRDIERRPFTNWAEVTRMEYDTFRLGSIFMDMCAGSESTAIPSSPSTASRYTRDPIADFKKGIKRDPSHFPTLKDEKQWDTWQRSTTAQAHAQDVDEVLNSTYKPLNALDKDLFQEKQKYMYAVFEKTLLTDQGKAFVRE